MCERACFVETETGAAVEAGVVVGDDRAKELLGVAEDLADVWQGVRNGYLVAIGPDDAAREVTATTDQSCLSEGRYAFIGL